MYITIYNSNNTMTYVKKKGGLKASELLEEE